MQGREDSKARGEDMEISITRLEMMAAEDWFREIEHGVKFCMAVEDGLGDDTGNGSGNYEYDEWEGSEEGLPVKLVRAARLEDVFSDL